MVISRGETPSPVEQPNTRWRTVENHRSSHVKGYNFEHEMSEVFWLIKREGENIFHYKLADTHAFDGMVKALRREGRDATYLTPKVPADFLVILNGRPIMIECKASSSNAVDMDGGWHGGEERGLVKAHQDAFAIDWVKNGHGAYYYFICEYPKTIYVFGLEERMKAGVWQSRAGFASTRWAELKPLALTEFQRVMGGSGSKWPYRAINAFLNQC